MRILAVLVVEGALSRRRYGALMQHEGWEVTSLLERTEANRIARAGAND
jgi:hypothetical protein